ncbi:MAG TPA: PadR family transcriptional regulator [Candidatus Sulfotelmatobacter sp.]|nr:PadR family transcriptional regulator [Candidatus Sulfotelmatobacter sp.]
MSNNYRDEIVQRLTRNLLDIQLLRLVKEHPSIWGYRIGKTIEADSHIRLGHGILYPLLNMLEKRGFLKSTIKQKCGRARKTYNVTEQGEQFLQTYYTILSEQLRITETN